MSRSERELLALGRLAPQFTFLLDDLAEENDEALWARALGAFVALDFAAADYGADSACAIAPGPGEGLRSTA